MKLAWWRSQIEQLYNDGRGAHPVMQALAPHVKAFDLSADRLYAIVEGLEMDLDPTRYSDWPGLRKFSWPAAGLAGQVSASIFRHPHAETLVFSAHLGLPFSQPPIITH